MVRRLPMAIALVAGLLFVAAPGTAQHPADCPAAEEGDGPPIELRVGDIVLRAHVKGGAAEGGQGTRVEGRLIGCEHDPRIQAVDGVEEADAEAASDPAAAFASALRLLHDLRVGLELGPGQDGRCVRARVDVVDAAGGIGTADDRPVSVELCGLPIDLSEDP